jgi:hypothetical protein
MEVLFEMTLYRSHSHYLARSLSEARLSQLTPAQRKARIRAQQRLSKARLRPTKTFATLTPLSQRLGTPGGTGSVWTIPTETSICRYVRNPHHPWTLTLVRKAHGLGFIFFPLHGQRTWPTPLAKPLISLCDPVAGEKLDSQNRNLETRPRC